MYIPQGYRKNYDPHSPHASYRKETCSDKNHTSTEIAGQNQTLHIMTNLITAIKIFESWHSFLSTVNHKTHSNQCKHMLKKIQSYCTNPTTTHEAQLIHSTETPSKEHTKIITRHYSKISHAQPHP